MDAVTLTVPAPARLCLPFHRRYPDRGGREGQPADGDGEETTGDADSRLRRRLARRRAARTRCPAPAGDQPANGTTAARVLMDKDRLKGAALTEASRGHTSCDPVELGRVGSRGSVAADRARSIFAQPIRSVQADDRHRWNDAL